MSEDGGDVQHGPVEESFILMPDDYEPRHSSPSLPTPSRLSTAEPEGLERLERPEQVERLEIASIQPQEVQDPSGLTSKQIT